MAPDVTQDDDEEGEEKESVDDILAQIKAAGGMLKISSTSTSVLLTFN